MNCVYISSTISWLLITALAIVFTRIDSDTTLANLLFIATTTVIWTTATLGVGRPYWPTVAFALLAAILIFELHLDIDILYGQ